MDKETSDVAWHQINERAQNMLATTLIEYGVDPPDEQQYELLRAGVAVGIAACAEHYRLNPLHTP